MKIEKKYSKKKSKTSKLQIVQGTASYFIIWLGN